MATNDGGIGMDFNSQICTTREQSERLLDLGLKAETADMCYQILYLDLGGVLKECTPSLEPYPPINNDRFIPAWSLHRLLCLLPSEYIFDIDFQRIMQDFIFRSQDMYDEVISCIEILIEEGYFYEEYLEERYEDVHE